MANHNQIQLTEWWTGPSSQLY